MVFSSLLFIFAFLALNLIVYRKVAPRYRNQVLLGFSLVFYAWGGPKYSMGDGLDAIGVADLINSILAVKELVYDKKLVTMDTLCKALAADFVGYEDVNALCVNATKYGNDDKAADDLANDIFNFIADYIESFQHVFGRYTAGILPVSGNTPFGEQVGALPSGRRA